MIAYVYIICVFFLGITSFLLWIMWVEPQSWATKPSGQFHYTDKPRYRVWTGKKKSHFHTNIIKYQHVHQTLHFFRILNHWIFSLFLTMVRPEQQKTAHHWLTGTPFDNPSHPFQTATGTYWLVVKVKRKSSFGALGKWNRCSATEASEHKKTGGHHPVFLFQNEDLEVVECIYFKICTCNIYIYM